MIKSINSSITSNWLSFGNKGQPQFILNSAHPLKFFKNMNLFTRELSTNGEHALAAGIILGLAGAGVGIYFVYLYFKYPPIATTDPILNAVPSEHPMEPLRFAHSDVESSIVANSFVENDIFSFLGLDLFQINVFLIIYNLLFLIQLLIVNNYDFILRKYFWYIKKHTVLHQYLNLRYVYMTTYINFFTPFVII